MYAPLFHPYIQTPLFTTPYVVVIVTSLTSIIAAVYISSSLPTSPRSITSLSFSSPTSEFLWTPDTLPTLHLIMPVWLSTLFADR